MDGARFNPHRAQLAASSGAQDLPAPAAATTPAGPADGTAHDSAYRAKAAEAAVKFESFFIGQMLHKMRESARAVGDHDRQQDSVNSDMLDMADNLVADQLAGRRAFGVADAILRQLLPPAQPPAPPAGGTGSAAAVTLAEKKSPPA